MNVTDSCLSFDLSNFFLAQLGLPAHDMVFIFFTFLREVIKSSVFKSFKKCNLHLKKNVAIDNLRSLASQIFGFFTSILQCKLQKIFIFVFILKLPSSNLPENPLRAPLKSENNLTQSVKSRVVALPIPMIGKVTHKNNDSICAKSQVIEYLVGSNHCVLFVYNKFICEK